MTSRGRRSDAPHVVVVGGGLAGITAALSCADGGARVTLLERRPRLGGATWSFERNGLWFDNGQHVFLRCCTAYRGLLDRIGATDRVHLQQRLDVPVLAPGGRVARIRRGRGPAPLHLARSLLAYRHLGLLDRVRLGRAARALARADLDDPALDEQTFEHWLRAHGQRDESIASLFELITLPTLNVPAAQASAQLGAFVFQVGLLHDAEAADLGWSRVPLARLHAEPAARALELAGVPVRREAQVRAVETVDGSVSAVQLDGERIEADAVVLAVPHDALGALLPTGALADPGSLDGLGVSPIVNVHVVYDRRVTDLTVAAGLGTPVQWVFDRTEAAGLDAGQCLAVSLSAADRWIGRRASELRDEIVAALASLFPAAGAARVVDAVVTREHTATFRGIPGTRALRPGSRTGVAGLFLAGAWTDTGWPATMEGAVRSGLSAAREALTTLERTRRLPEEVVA